MFTKIVLSKDNIFDIIKSVVFSLIFSIVFVLIFAIFVKSFSLNENTIVIVNYCNKILSILLGCLIGIKHSEKGIIKGLLVSLLYYFLSYLCFSIFANDFTLININFIDILCLSFAGIISGIITVNIKK